VPKEVTFPKKCSWFVNYRYHFPAAFEQMLPQAATENAGLVGGTMAFFAASNKNLFQYADEIACRLNLQYVFSHSPAVPAVERERILPPALAWAKPPA